jgi:hypothetical protein
LDDFLRDLDLDNLEKDLLFSDLDDDDEDGNQPTTNNNKDNE